MRSNLKVALTIGIALLFFVTVDTSLYGQESKVKFNDQKATLEARQAKKVEVRKAIFANGKKEYVSKLVPVPEKIKYVLQVSGDFTPDGFLIDGVSDTSPCQHLHTEPDNNGDEVRLESGDIIITIDGYLVDGVDAYFAALSEAATNDPNNVALEIKDVETGKITTLYVKPRKHI